MGKKQKRKNKSNGREGAATPHEETSLAMAAFVAADAGDAVDVEAVGADEASAAPAEPPVEAAALETETETETETEPASEEPASEEPNSERLVPGYDLDADESYDVAPIGPTEPHDFPPSIPPALLRSAESPDAPSVDEIEQQIRDLEARLDQMIGNSRERTEAPLPSSLPPAAPVPEIPGAAPTSDVPASSPEDKAPDAPTASEVLSPSFYARQWGRDGLRSRSEEVDEFGLDPTFEAKVLPVLDFLSKRYFRVKIEGAEHIPAEGRGLVVANHSGGPLPYDGAMLRAAVRREHPAHRPLRWLAEDFVYYLPFVGTLMNRLGAVRACQENAERLLQKGELVAVFPEGAKGIGKLYRDRYKLQRFGRGGFIRLCLRTRTPLVPCAIVGAEEANPMLYRFEYMTKSLGIPYFPVTPTFPALGLLGLMPAPTKWRIRFGEPLTWSNYGPDAADDDILVGRLAERVRASIQSMLDRMLEERRSIWLG